MCLWLGCAGRNLLQVYRNVSIFITALLNKKVSPSSTVTCRSYYGTPAFTCDAIYLGCAGGNFVLVNRNVSIFITAPLDKKFPPRVLSPANITMEHLHTPVMLFYLPPISASDSHQLMHLLDTCFIITHLHAACSTPALSLCLGPTGKWRLT